LNQEKIDMKAFSTINLLIFFSIMLLSVKMPLELIHAVVWVVKHIYVFIEFMLDEIISLTFDTDPRTTEIIVFYLMLGIGAIMAVVIFNYIVDLWRQAKETVPAWCFEQKAQLQNTWQTSPMIKKSKVVCSIALGGSFAVMLTLG